MNKMMRTWLILAAIILVPVFVIAQETAPAAYEYRGSLITGGYIAKLFASVAFVAVIAFIAAKILRKYRPEKGVKNNEGMEYYVVDTKFISPDKRIVKAVIDGKIYILAITKDSVFVLDKKSGTKAKK